MAGHLLEVRNLSVTLPKGADREFAVDKVNFTVNPGEIVCLVGEYQEVGPLREFPRRPYPLRQVVRQVARVCLLLDLDLSGVVLERMHEDLRSLEIACR